MAGSQARGWDRHSGRATEPPRPQRKAASDPAKSAEWFLRLSTLGPGIRVALRPATLCIQAATLRPAGTTAKSTADCRKLDPQGVVAFHQADIGEYLRDEDTLC